MMKTLLLSPPYVREYMRNARCDFVSLSGSQWYPILLGYCGAYLEGKGYQVKLIDAPAQGLSHEQTRQIIREYHPQLLILYTGRMSEDNDIAFADPLVEELKCDAVIVGPYASIDPAATLAKAKVIEKLIVGEFEHPVGEVAAGQNLEGIGNLIYKKDGQIVYNSIRPYLNSQELDAIPFVSRFFSKQLDIYNYKTPSEYYPFMDIMTGRGCAWGQCTYCLWVNSYIKGMVYNQRSVSNVIEEIGFIKENLPQVRSVMVQDDTFTEERALEFSEAKIKAKIKLPWSCYAKGNMSYEIMKIMQQAGCRNLHVGYESASQHVLRRIKKGISVEKMTTFTRDAHRAGLRIHGDFAFGFPGETMEDAQKTIDWAYSLNPHTAQFQLMIPFAGTPYYEEMKENNWLNAEGQPDMPQFSNDQIRAMAKRAYRRFYLSPKYLWKCICHPYEHFGGRIKTIMRAVPAMFWQRWGTSQCAKEGQV